MIRFPNPLAGVSQIVGKAFSILGERDGVGRRTSFGIGLSHDAEERRPPRPSPEDTSRTTIGRPGSDER